MVWRPNQWVYSSRFSMGFQRYDIMEAHIWLVNTNSSENRHRKHEGTAKEKNVVYHINFRQTCTTYFSIQFKQNWSLCFWYLTLRLTYHSNSKRLSNAT